LGCFGFSFLDRPFKIAEIEAVTFRAEIINNPIVGAFRFAIPIDFYVWTSRVSRSWEIGVFS
jgi:hypothetical protein